MFYLRKAVEPKLMNAEAKNLHTGIGNRRKVSTFEIESSRYI
jgi:hypothetical protein